MALQLRKLISTSSSGSSTVPPPSIVGGAPTAIESVFAAETFGSISDTAGLTYIKNGVGLGSDPAMTVWNFPITNGTTSLPIYAPVFDALGNAYVLLQPQDGSGNGLPSVAKVGANGALQWINQLTAGAAGNGVVQGCACDSAGNVYVTAILIPSGASSTQYLSLFKFNTSGVLQWHTDITVGVNCTFSQTVQSPSMLIVDGDSNPVLIAPIIDLAGQRAWVSKFNATTGALSWNFQTHEVAYVINSMAIATDPTDHDSGSLYFGFGTSGDGGQLHKLDLNGNWLWSYTLYDTASGNPNGTTNFTINAITVGLSSEVTVVGGAHNTVSGFAYGYLAQFTSGGAVSWQRNFYIASNTGTPATTTFNGLSVTLNIALHDVTSDAAGNLYAICWLGDSIKTTVVVKYAPGGQFQWEYLYTYAGLPAANNRLDQIAIDTNNNLYVAGSLTTNLQGGILKWSAADSAFVAAIGSGPVIDSPGTLTISSQTLSTSTASPTTFTAITNGFAVSQPITIGFTVTSIPRNTSAGGMVWLAARQVDNSQMLFDMDQGLSSFLSSSNTSGVQAVTGRQEVATFSPQGFYVGNDPNGILSSGETVSWAWRRAPRFFDVQLYTGNGTSQAIPHNLQCQPGIIVVKSLTSAGNWPVYHRGMPNGCSFWNNATGNVPAIKAGSAWWASFANLSGGSTTNYCLGVGVDAEGNFYAGLNLSSGGTLVKYNNAGAIIWQQLITTQAIGSICVDSSDGIYAMCTDGTFFKYNTSGVLQFQRSVPNNSGGGGYVRMATGGGNVYIAYGSAYSSSAGVSYLTCYSAAGTFAWQNQLTLTNVSAILVGLGGSIYLAGNSVISGASTAGWLGSFTSAGTLNWQQNFSQAEGMGLYALAMGPNPIPAQTGEVLYVGGNVITYGLLMVVSTSGAILETSTFLGGGITAITADQLGNVYIAGHTNNQGFGGPDNFVALLSEGIAQVSWSQWFNDAGNTVEFDSMVTSMAIDGNGGLFVGFSDNPYVVYLRQDGTASPGTINPGFGTAVSMPSITLAMGDYNAGAGTPSGSITDATGSYTVTVGATNDTVGVNSTHAGSMNLTLVNMPAILTPAANYFGNNTALVAPTTANFTVGDSADVNATGILYIAYLFAHDPTANGIIQCDSYTIPLASGSENVSLGWEPQYIMAASENNGVVWSVSDAARGFAYRNFNPLILTASTTGEQTVNGGPWSLVSGGFVGSNAGGVTPANIPVLYMAIRRGPMLLPTTGLQVYNAATYTGTENPLTISTIGFQPDLVIFHARSTTQGVPWYIKQYGTRYYLDSTTSNLVTDAGQNRGCEVIADGVLVGPITDAELAADNTVGENTAGRTEVMWCFTRQPNVFDSSLFFNNVVGSTLTIGHELGVIPEMVIIKDIQSNSSTPSQTESWYIYHKALGIANLLNFSSAVPASTNILAGSPTATQLVVQNLAVAGSSDVYTAFMFATLAGISSVGSYVGNGTSQIINCGFTSGARFVMIKRTDAVGDWYIFDTARGINSLGTASPFVTMDTTAAEGSSASSIGPSSQGFAVDQDAATTNINVNGGHYIFLAFA